MCIGGHHKSTPKLQRSYSVHEALKTALKMFKLTGRAVFLQLADKLSGKEPKDLDYYETTPEFKRHVLNSQMTKVKEVVSIMLKQECGANGCSNEALVPYEYCGGRCLCEVFGEQIVQPAPEMMDDRRDSDDQLRRPSHLQALLRAKSKKGMTRGMDRGFSIRDVMEAKRRNTTTTFGGQGSARSEDGTKGLVHTASVILSRAELHTEDGWEIRERDILQKTVEKAVSTEDAVDSVEISEVVEMLMKTPETSNLEDDE